MRAVTVPEPGGPEALTVSDVATPTAGPGEVLVAVHAAGVNRADLLQRQGHYPPPPGAPEVLGLECAGTVAEVGDGVDRLRVGEACVALLAGGGQAEYVAAPAGQVLPAPPGVDQTAAGGLMEVAATVVSNLQHASLTAGDTVLIHGGSGGIGAFAVQYARAAGATVLATAGSDDKRDYCRELGASHAIDYHGDWVREAREATDGRGVDVVLDVMGAAYLGPNVDVLAPDGRIAVIGMQGGAKGTLDLGAMLAKRATLSATGLRARPVEQKAAVCADVQRLVWPMLADGRVVPTRQTTYPLAEVAEAHRRLESGDNVGKIVLTV